VSAVPPLLDSLRAFPPVAGTDAGAGARQSLLDGVLADGLPTQRLERWKYTSLRPLSARRFVASAPTPSLHPALLVDIPAPRLVFVNGRFDAALSSHDALPDGVRLSAGGDDAANAADAAADDADNRPDAAFARLNRALATDGALLQVLPGATPSVPLHLVFVGAPAEGDIASHLRHRVAVGAGARATLVEHHIAAGGHRHLANHLFAIALDAGARLVHARLQDEDDGASLFARSEVVLGADADYQRVDLELGAALARCELAVSLLGAGASLTSGGALLAAGRRHLDTRLEIRHVARDTRCDLRWRGLAADRARLAFHGGIRILAGADGAEAALSNKNLLLSDQAEVDTQPVLEIDADEVKAAHGATVGRLDPTALFYLRSRGIGEAEARSLLTLAFCREALAVLDDPALAALLSPRLESRLLAIGLPA
jgi:Fe-S cluster assembly protein SufD